MIKPITEQLLLCFTTVHIPTAACRFIRQRRGHISVLLSQAHHSLRGVITVHPSSSFTLQLEKAQEHCQIFSSEVMEMLP